MKDTLYQHVLLNAPEDHRTSYGNWLVEGRPWYVEALDADYVHLVSRAGHHVPVPRDAVEGVEQVRHPDVAYRVDLAGRMVIGNPRSVCGYREAKFVRWIVEVA